MRMVAALIAVVSIVARVPRAPVIVHGAGRFTAIRIARPPATAGGEWIAASPEPVNRPGTVASKAKHLTLVARECGDHGGDFERCQLLLQRGRQTVPIKTGWTGWAFVTPDERYVISEPLDILDVHAWKLYRLSEALAIPNYTNIEAISRDGRRLIVSRTDCPMDCRSPQTFQYYVLRLP
jgi:hypothetical protein